MMLKSVIAAVASAAVLVSAKDNVTQECNPVVSGKLQWFSFNVTGGFVPLGVNASKAGEYVSRDATHFPEVVFESCQKMKMLKGGVMATPYTKLSLKEHKGLCVTHHGSSKNHTGEVTVEKCAKGEKVDKKDQEWGLVYGKEMEGQNATLLARFTEHERVQVLPMVEPFLPVDEHGHGPSFNITRMTVGSAVGYGTLLQIANPKKAY